MRSILVTGSSGLIGSEVCSYFHGLGYEVHGLDNNQRAVFFGSQGDTRWNQRRLQESLARFHHHELDIRDRQQVHDLLQEIRPFAVVHAAAQPSHDRAAAIPFDDFDVNAVGTLNLLEATRQVDSGTRFVFMSTNKVYGDRPNSVKLVEHKTRYEFGDFLFRNGISESMSVDQSKHSLFGASKLAADVLVQEYGRYFGMNTCCLRGGCLTGPNHSGVELHGFLSYLVKCNVQRKVYRIYGYQGKQVRDNIHSVDVAMFIEQFIDAPRQGEVYNIGGGKANSISILEAFELVEAFTGIKQESEYVPTPRIGDHICYYSDLRKIKSHYPKWEVSIPIETIVKQLATRAKELSGF